MGMFNAMQSHMVLCYATNTLDMVGVSIARGEVVIMMMM
jgi:hypothetical protein